MSQSFSRNEEMIVFPVESSFIVWLNNLGYVMGCNENGVEIECSSCSRFKENNGERGGDTSGNRSPSSLPKEKTEHKKKTRKVVTQSTAFDLLNI